MAEDKSGAGEAPGIESMTSLGEGENLVGGRIKWFDMVKGYGFVTPDEPGGDILVHYNLLARYGRKSLPEGTRVIVAARETPRGRQASAIVDLDISQATGPDLERVAPRGGGSRQDPLDFLDKAGDFEPCEVRWFNRAKGYGFLLRSDGVTQVFIHMETVRRGGLDSLLPGQLLDARIHDGPRGALAVVIRPVEEVRH